jgi:AcrR family transcriptional regulator
VYWHFPNKRALFLALVAESVSQNLVTLDQFLAAAATKPGQLKQRLGEWIDGIDERESLPAFGAELEIESRHDEQFRAAQQQMIAGYEERLGDFLRRYFDAVQEEPAMPPLEMAQVLITTFKGFALSRQNRPVDPPKSAKVVRLLLGLPIAPK